VCPHLNFTHSYIYFFLKELRAPACRRCCVAVIVVVVVVVVAAAAVSAALRR